MIPRCKVGKGVTGAVRYILGEGRHPETGDPRKIGPDEISRVEWFGGFNFGFAVESREDAELARRIMEFDALNQQSRTRRCEKDCVHLSLGWRIGEEPTREQMEAAARGALAAIGMGNAKALFSSHADEDYAHIHIVASKINPETGRAYDLKGNYLRLSRWAEQYEREHSGGIVCTRREEANRLRDAIDKRHAGAVLALLTEQRSTFTARDLERVLGKQIKGQLARAEFAEAILTHPDAVRLSDQAGGQTTRYSTRQVLDAEAHVLRAAEGLARSDRHLVGDQLRASVLSRAGFDGMSREQVRAVRHATGAEGLALIDGQAGTGKSFTVAAIRQVYEAQRCTVIGLAPTNAVAQDMQENGFAHARTVHSELFSLNNGRSQWDARTVIMVDEAAMIDTRNMAMLAAHAYAAGAKLILVGDDRQLSSIERGGMFGVLKDRYGASYVALTRHRDKTQLFVATNTARDLKQLARQMARVDERRAASHFHRVGGSDPVRPLTPRELAAQLADPALRHRDENRETALRQREESDKRQAPAVEPAARAARDRDKHLHPPAAGETKPTNRYERFTPGPDLPPDMRTRTQDRGRGGRGGRTR